METFLTKLRPKEACIWEYCRGRVRICENADQNLSLTGELTDSK